MRAKKTTGILLAALLLLVCLTGCGGSGGAPPGNSGGVPTLTIGIRRLATVEDYETNEFTLWLEERLGVNLDFVYFSGDAPEMLQQLSLMMARGEKLPDILWYFTLGKTTMRRYGEEGYFLDLAPYFEAGSPCFDEAVSRISVEEDRDMILSLGADSETGAIYAFPCYQHSSGPDNATEHVLINRAWLDALGEEMPTTPEELRTVLRRFAAEDPNGNGLADELPMVGARRISRGDTLQWLINAYIYCNDQYFWNVDDGVVSVPYVADEYRQALIFLNELYEEDLLSPQVFTISANDEMKEILTPSDGTAIAGITGGHISLIHNPGSDLLFDYCYLPVPDAGTGRGGWRPQSGSVFRYSTYVTKDCKDPALAFRLLDFLCSEEAFLFMRYGVEGRDWEYAEDGMLDMYGEQAAINVIDASVFSAPNNVCWHALDSTIADYSSHTMYSPAAQSGSYTERFNAWKDQFTRDLFRDETKPELIFQILYPDGEEEEVASCVERIRACVVEEREMFVSGMKDPRDERTWNEYLDELEELGLSRCTRITQACYDNMHGISPQNSEQPN